MPNNEMPYVIAAYAAAWLALVGYALYLRGVVQRAERLRDTGAGRTAS
jgi:CcmD family protein